LDALDKYDQSWDKEHPNSVNFPDGWKVEYFHMNDNKPYDWSTSGDFLLKNLRSQDHLFLKDIQCLAKINWIPRNLLKDFSERVAKKI
jgi:hypothetical protein